MRPQVSGSTAPPLVRVAAVSVASVLLGVLAHGSVADVLPRPGSLFVIVVLVSTLVAGMLAGGRAVGRWLERRGWRVPVEDAAGALALVAGQALVHWSVLPLGVPLAGSGSVGFGGHGYGAHHGDGAHQVHGVVMHHTSGSSAGMLAAHAAAALMVAAVLRWVEDAIVGLAHVLRLVHASTSLCIGVLQTCFFLVPASASGKSGDRANPWWGSDARPRMRVALLPLERRGPPSAGRNQHVISA
jgi:hypothetical protein